MIRWMRDFAELPSRIPQLEDVLALAAGNQIVFDIEMKECGRLTPLSARVCGDGSGAGGSELAGQPSDGAVVRHSFLRAMHVLRPEVPLAALVGESGRDWVPSAGEQCRLHFAALSLRHGARGAQGARGWNCRDSVDVERSAHWTKLIARGVDAIVTDDPAALVRFRRRARSS